MLVPTPIYHITHVDNLPGILHAGGLCSYQHLEEKGTPYADIAHHDVQRRRARTLVPCGPGGRLHEYVPFYFAPRSPMLYVAWKGNLPGYSYGEGQQPLVHLVSSAQAVAEAGLGFAFADGHAIVALSTFYDDLAHLSAIDWPLMESRYWNDTREDGDRSRRRQAEFLVHRLFPWNLVTEVGVIGKKVKDQVTAILADADHRPQVIVRADWYY